MSDKKSESTSQDDSLENSPEDPRALSTRFQSITGEDDRNDSAPSGTVRRSRPSPISTSTGQSLWQLLLLGCEALTYLQIDLYS